jgi:DNA-binding NarL/FixJ family response regulator
MDPVPEVVGEVSLVALHHRSPGEQPDVVLVDATQDIGMEEVALAAAEWRNLPLLALGSLERREEAVRQGTVFVARDANIQDLQSAISDAVAGRMQCPAKLNGGPIEPVQPRAAVDAGAHGSEHDAAGDRGSADDWPRPRQ